MENPAPALNNVAQAMFDCALEDSAAHLGFASTREMLAELRKGDCYQCDTVRYYLARQVADYLSVANPNLRAIYLYDPDYALGDYERVRTAPSASSAVSLIVWNRSRDLELEKTLEHLREDLQDAKQGALCPKATGVCFNLDAALVDDHDVSRRRGYAALLDSYTIRPTRIWSRE